jgi:hypothetical protein
VAGDVSKAAVWRHSATGPGDGSTGVEPGDAEGLSDGPMLGASDGSAEATGVLLGDAAGEPHAVSSRTAAGAMERARFMGTPSGRGHVSDSPIVTGHPAVALR